MVLVASAYHQLHHVTIVLYSLVLIPEVNISLWPRPTFPSGTDQWSYMDSK